MVNTKFPIDEKHSQALRQLLDKAEILRKVFKFIKDKKLIGGQTKEPVKTIRGQPGLTIEEHYNELKNLNYID